jgi:hypothetical protein
MCLAAAPNILILMVDQLTGTLFPDGPADFCTRPTCAAGGPVGAVCQCLHRLARFARRAGQLHVGPVAAPHAGL